MEIPEYASPRGTQSMKRECVRDDEMVSATQTGISRGIRGTLLALFPATEQNDHCNYQEY